MSFAVILRNYAQKDPASLPASVLFAHTPRSITIYDAFPKSIFHFLVLPRLQPNVPVTLSNLDGLKSLLKCDKELAKQILIGLSEDAASIRREIEQEMLTRYGFKWPIWIGFHAVPSMQLVSLEFWPCII
jgi:aprataxin